MNKIKQKIAKFEFLMDERTEIVTGIYYPNAQ